MLPIVNALKLQRRSRIWLCPTAAFTSIPLHAASPFQTKADRSKEPCLQDLYIYSYTPTLTALGQSGAGKGKALLTIDNGLALVHKLIPATADCTISGGAAIQAEDLKLAYHSHFVMRDEHLALLDVTEKDIPHAEFSFLSACHTAVSDEEMPDEVIHLAAGLQFSGFKSVVGTLWEVVLICNPVVFKHNHCTPYCSYFVFVYAFRFFLPKFRVINSFAVLSFA
ncbi:hypothetical protein EDD22DRAFT_971937 [Suillus occidentalis]|nr:hypothetical protein EDD22DRAFT_971937 [Suillus occidentalis]